MSSTPFFSYDGKKYSKDGNWGQKDSAGYPKQILGREVVVHPNEGAKRLVKKPKGMVVQTNPERTNWFLGEHGNIHQYPLGENLKSNYIDWTGGKAKLVEAKNYGQIVQKIGEVYYGAKWFPESNTFILDGSEKHNSTSKMEDYRELGGGTGLTLIGWGKQAVKDAIKIIEGFNLQPTTSTQAPTTDEMTFTKRATEITEQNYELFSGVYKNKKYEIIEKKIGDKIIKGDQTIADWQNGMKKDKKNVKSIASLVGSLYAFLSVNGKSGSPEYLTKTLERIPIETRMEMLGDMGRIYQHWVQTLYTPTSWWRLPFMIEESEFPKMPTTLEQVEKNLKNARVKNVMPSIWDKRGGNLPDGMQGDEIKTQKESLVYAGYSSVKTMKHAVASYVASTLGNPVGQWKMPDQKAGAFFSRGVPPAKYGTIGKDLTPLQVQRGMDFLATGKNPDIKDDVPENHYNDSLSFYEEYGSPYGELAPANMFFRIALSGTGWRRQEALTAQSQELASYPADEDKLKKKLKSGIYLDKEFGLGVKFMTRKTAKYDHPDHTSNIPPFSSDLIDTTKTINMILKQANVGQIYVKYDKKFDEKTKTYSLKFAQGFPKFVPASEEDKKNWHPAKRTFKYNGSNKTNELAMDIEAGQTPKLLIGADGQFLPMEQVELADDTKESKIGWEEQMIRAYLYFPFKEMYAVMEGTGVKIRTPEEITRVRNKDRNFLIDKLHKKSFPIFEMFDKPTVAETLKFGKKLFGIGWATKCGKGCKPKWLNKIAVGYSNVDKMNQDDYRYDDESGGGVGYWISRPAHSIRHIFAQTWLNIFDWNYGLVADYGHWQVMETLKTNYGKIPDDRVKQQIAEGFAKTWGEEDSEKAQAYADAQASIISDHITTQAIENLQTPIEGDKPVTGIPEGEPDVEETDTDNAPPTEEPTEEPKDE